jgi:carboxymethylenebutenolidase
VLHAWWGLNDFIRGMCDRLAREGYTAYAPDLFSGKVAQSVAEAEQQVDQVNPQELVPTLRSAVEAFRQHPAVTGEALGVVGFSFGGAWALWLANTQPQVRKVAIFYATDGGMNDFQKSNAEFLGHFAENDPFEPASAVADLETRLHHANRPAAFYTYPGTGHWFFEADRPEAYDPASAQLAWERTLAFLADLK